MKKTIEDRILLAQAGELSPREREQLERDMASNPSHCAYRDDLDVLASATREGLSTDDVSDLTMQRIRAAAEQAARPPHRTRQAPTWSPAFAYAAAAVLVLGAGLFFLNRLNGPKAPQVAEEAPSQVVPPEILAWDADLDAEIQALDEMMAMALGETDENGTTQESLEDLAEELIELEGIQI